jgi:hypothetical protein
MLQSSNKGTQQATNLEQIQQELAVINRQREVTERQIIITTTALVLVWMTAVVAGLVVVHLCWYPTHIGYEPISTRVLDPSTNPAVH